MRVLLSCISLGIFKFCNYIDKEDGDCCFALIVFLIVCLVTDSVVCLFLTVTWVGLLCVIVVFPDHTHLFWTHFPASITASNIA